MPFPEERVKPHQVRVYIQDLSSAVQHPIHRVDRPIRRLALAILIRALRDGSGRRTNSSEGASETLDWHQDALEWLCSESDQVGSLLWICDLLEMPPAKLRSWVRTFLQSSQARQTEIMKRLLRSRIRN